MHSMLDAKCKCHIKRSMGAQKTWWTLKLCSVFRRSWILPCMVASSTSERENMVSASTQVKETMGKHDTFFVLSGTMGAQKGIEWKKRNCETDQCVINQRQKNESATLFHCKKPECSKVEALQANKKLLNWRNMTGEKKMHMEPIPVF